MQAIFTDRTFPHGEISGLISAMDLAEIRRQRLREIIDTRFNGVAAHFAAAIGREPSYVSRALTDNAKHRKNIGEDLAREIERALRLPAGYLDNQHSAASTPIPGTPPAREIPRIRWDQIDSWLTQQVNYAPDPTARSIFCAGAGPRAFALQVSGDTMASLHNPSAPAGSWIVVDPDTSEGPHSLVLARANGLQTPIFKQLVSDAGQQFLKSLNPAYPPIAVQGELQVIGFIQEITPF